MRVMTIDHKRKISEANKKYYANLSDKEKNKYRFMFAGEKAHNWKGDKASYHATHHWVSLWKGKAEKCSNCDSKKRAEWANKDHKYKKKLEDYMALCRKCHVAYDIKKGLRISKKKKGGAK